MANDYVITTNESGELAVRTVSATEASNITDTLSVITRTDDGKLAVRTVGGGGSGDQHNLGYYATQAALEEAHPTAEAGDWAIVGSTDTVWIWDDDNSEWVDSDQKGQVTSVNGQTGDVVLDLLPSQTGNAGKFLTTDGTDASWSDKPTRSIRNGATGTASMVARPFSENYNYTVQYCTAFGLYANFSSSAVTGATIFGTGTDFNNTTAGYYSTAVGYRTNAGGANPSTQAHAIAYGAYAKATANHSAQFGSTGSQTINSDANTYKFANENGNFEIMSADGTIPTARFATDPVADGTYVLTVTVSSGVATRSWAASASGTSSISVTLPAADWVSDAQTVTATGVTSSNTVIIGAAPNSASEYNTCGVICTAQGTDSLTFTCTSTPTNDLTVTVLILA